MDINFNEQDLRNAICVQTALDHQQRFRSGNRPEDVQCEVLHRNGIGFFAWAEIDDDRYEFSENQIINAIGGYLHRYHSFDPGLLEVNLNRSHEGELSAQIATVR